MSAITDTDEEFVKRVIKIGDEDFFIRWLGPQTFEQIQKIPTDAARQEQYLKAFKKLKLTEKYKKMMLIS